MLVWKKLWVHLKTWITGIFTASINLGYHPRQWRSAKIIVLRKPGKPDYSVPGAYRPISLLNTLGKLLEAVMARRLSYLAEKHSLLPNSQFGGRPGRTTEQALLVLSNAIDQAWYKHRVVTLIAFDLKGAFNGVNWVSLDASLQKKGIPTVARKWIASFMSDRHANRGGFGPGASLEGTRSTGHQTRYENDYRSEWTTTLTPRTNATALPSVCHTRHRLCIYSLA
jgi:hypothetical protein